MIPCRKELLTALALALLVSVTAPASDLAFTYVRVGDELPTHELMRYDEGTVDYLGGPDVQARVFAFVKEGRQSSLALLDTVNVLQRDFADRAVHWSLILSGRSSAGWPDTVAARCPAAEVLVDEGDVLYGKLGVPLTPVLGIGDAGCVLRSYLTYRKINFRPVIAAHLKFVLGDITQEELDKALNPSGRARDTAAASAGRKLKLARMLLAKQKTELALKQVESAIEETPELREAYELLAEIHLANGDEGRAAEARAKAESLAGPDDGSSGTEGDGN